MRGRSGSARRAGGRHVGAGVAAMITVAMMVAAWPGHAQRFVATPDPEHPKLKYADSLTSLNDRCAVARNKLNPKVRPVYVNGQPIGFC